MSSTILALDDKAAHVHPGSISLTSEVRVGRWPQLAVTVPASGGRQVFVYEAGSLLNPAEPLTLAAASETESLPLALACLATLHERAPRTHYHLALGARSLNLDFAASTAALGYRLEGGQIAFRFDPRDFSLRSPHAISVAGSFTSWRATEPEWQMRENSQGVWELRVPANAVTAPGCSGFPEFKFVLDGTRWLPPHPSLVTGHCYSDSRDGLNNTITRGPAEVAQVIRQHAELEAQLRRGGRDAITFANWRELPVPAQGVLFRAASPWHESERGAAVRRLMAQYGIQSAASLCGDECERTRPLLLARSYLGLNISFDDFNLRADTPTVASHLARLVEFLAGAPFPALIHCYEGKDRTGVLCAVVEALAGVPWDTILSDYRASYDAGFASLPHPNMLMHILRLMVGDGFANLQPRIRNYLMERGAAKEDLLNQLAARLTGA